MENSHLRENLLDNRQILFDTRKQLESQGFSLNWKSETASINRYGFQKRYESNDDRFIEYNAWIFFDVNVVRYEINNIIVQTYHIYNSGTRLASDRNNIQEKPVSSVQQAIDIIKEYFDRELEKHQFHIMMIIHDALDRGNIPKFVNSIEYFKTLGVTWSELDSIVEKSRDEIFQKVLPLVSEYLVSGRGKLYFTAINDLKQKFHVNWPELNLLDPFSFEVDSTVWNNTKIKKTLMKLILERMQSSYNEMQYQAVKWLDLLKHKQCPWPELSVIEKYFADMKMI